MYIIRFMTNNVVRSVDPYTENEIATYQLMSSFDIDNQIKKSQIAFQYWKKFTYEKRILLINLFKTKLINDLDTAAQLITSEMGKPISQSRLELKKCISLCEYYIENIGEFLKPNTFLETDLGDYSRYILPIGGVLGIMPWNFPFWQVMRFCIPNLLLGNVVLLKHASNVSGCNLYIENLFKEALKDFKNFLYSEKNLSNNIEDLDNINNVYFSLIIKPEQVEHIIKNNFIQGVSLTGSEKAGASVASIAGKYLKKSLLELGGSDPYIVLDDADLDLAASKIVESRMINSGQSCIGAKRVIGDKKIISQLSDLILFKIKKYNIGDPKDIKTMVGPLAKKDFKDLLSTQVSRSVDMGAQLISTQKLQSNKSFFVSPLVLTKVRPGMPVFEDETFGPLISIIEAQNTEDAIDLANKSKYGLGAAIFSMDIKKAQGIAQNKISSGMCAINDFVKSDPRLPFGGVKLSGYGRELSKEGLLEFCNLKVIFNAKMHLKN